jgi:excisionase family DNA binding protein
MNEPGKNAILGEALRGEIKELVREVVREEIRAVIEAKDKGPKDWLRAEELAEEFGMPKTWFEERGRAGEIARTKPGRYVLFKRRDVEAYLESHKKINGGS